MRWLVLSAALFLAGCDSGMYAQTSGFIGPTQFNEPVTVYHGGPFLVLFDRQVDCLDLAWVEKAYNQAQSPTELDFVGVQFAWEDEMNVGTFSVAGDAAVNGYGYSNLGGVFEIFRAREGTITIEGIGPARHDPAMGSFAVTFADGSQLAGEFETEWCRNLRAG